MDRYDLDDIGGQPHIHSDGDWVKYDDVQAEIERLTALLHQAHMAGQVDAGVDPSWSNAQAWVLEQEPNND